MFSACCANEERASVAPRLQGAISMGYAQFNACLDSRESARMEFSGTTALFFTTIE
jgi:hypothetical protein